MQEFVNRILEGYGKAVASLGTLWVLVPSPVTITSGAGGAAVEGAPPASGGFETLLQYVVWVSLGIAVVSLIIAGALMAARRRRGDGEAHLGRVGVILASVILVSSASALVAGILPGAAPAGSSSVVGFIQNQLWWYTGGLAVLSVLIAAARMAWTQRAQPARELLQSLLTLIAVSGAGLTGIVLAVMASDAFSVWILNNSTDCDVTNSESNCFGTNVFMMIGLTAGSQNALGVIAVFCLGLIALLMTFGQIALMIVRGGMLVVLAGILPITASFTNTEMGRNWFRRSLGWTIAFILYKPAAAIVYATAFRLTGADLFVTDGSGLVQLLTGLALMLIALVALPALMRFVVPAVGAMSGGGGGGASLALVGAGVSAAGAVATGAIRSGGGSGGGFGSSPSGSTPAPPSSPAPPTGPSGGGGVATGGGSAASVGSAASGGGSAAVGGATAGAGAGPIGMAAGMAVGLAAGQVAQGAKQAGAAAKSFADDATGSENR
ncbi:hypothetical protein DDQ50_16445 [Amnibacterium flavum]|uniref:Uncharacterized protein n=1 Tax=Amnibacterium flavum TaxID=2173173 RepID=A0A2V1HL36_9MICO|nr:hypothetical protein DDQ50_16445 [Amnibacterium flavum]